MIATICDLSYSFFSRRRGLLRMLTHLFLGKRRLPSEYHCLTRLFLICLGIIYFFAFTSLSVQITGLVGSKGILPLENFVSELKSVYDLNAIRYAPSIFLFYCDDVFLLFICVAGVALSGCLIFGYFVTPALILLYFLYLSLFYAGQNFMTFQWDLLLLEAGFLAIFLRHGGQLVVWLYRWLIFRFMFMGGMVKILSKDPSWDNLTALNYHFETQPLPTIPAYFAHHLPDGLLMLAVATTLFIEIILPFFIFGGRQFRKLVAVVFILFQFFIILTGNYNFFNLLTICICFFLFDDSVFRNIRLRNITSFLRGKNRICTKLNPLILSLPLVCIITFSSMEQLITRLSDTESSEVSSLTRLLYPFHITQNYGPFAVMTTERNEIIIEGSEDGRIWKAYEFKYKPGNVTRHPIWVTPHQPRLDWQMWFAALSHPDQHIWFGNLLFRLLENERSVTRLFDFNPFENDGPNYIRASYFRYRFSEPDELKNSRAWWSREYRGQYMAPVQLQ